MLDILVGIFDSILAIYFAIRVDKAIRKAEKFNQLIPFLVGMFYLVLTFIAVNLALYYFNL